MRPISVVGVVLIVLGVLALVYQGITYTTKETVIDIGPLHATADRQKTLPLSPVLGIVAVAGGWRCCSRGLEGRVTRHAALSPQLSISERALMTSTTSEGDCRVIERIASTRSNSPAGERQPTPRDSEERAHLLHLEQDRPRRHHGRRKEQGEDESVAVHPTTTTSPPADTLREM
jgi:hypothetical protein